LPDSNRDRPIPRVLAIDSSKAVVGRAAAADMALYHRFENPLFARLLQRLADDESLTVLLAAENASSRPQAGGGRLRRAAVARRGARRPERRSPPPTRSVSAAAA